jgi:hypothetical protein
VSDIFERAIELKLDELGIKNIQFNRPYVHFVCEGKCFRCVYRSDYPDPREHEWDISTIDQELINQNQLVFRRDGELIFSLYGENLCHSVTLMGYTRVIASFLRILQVEVNAARRKIVFLMNNCATYQEASDMLKEWPRLCADAKGGKTLLPMLWGQVTRRRRSMTARLEKAKC